MIISSDGRYLNVRKKCILYGYGKWLSFRLGWFKCIDDIIGIADRNEEKSIELKERGYNYILPEKIKELEFDYIIITSELRFGEIFEELYKNYNIPEKKLLSGMKLWNNFEDICDGITEINFGSRNSEKIFYVIAPLSPWFNNGLINLASKVYHNMCYAKEKGYIAVVDMKNFYTIYHQDYEIGNVNVWDKYYTIKSNIQYDLDTVYESRRVVFCFSKLETEQYNIEKMDLSKSCFYNFIEEKISIKREIKSAYNRIFKKVISTHARVLGVAIRGSDYNLLKIKKHYIQPDISLIKAEIDKAIDRWRIDYLYIISEERRSIDYMYKLYKEKVLTYDCPLYDTYADTLGQIKGVVGEVKFKREDDGFLRGKEYLISTILLSYCNCFISGINSKSYFLLDDLKINFEKYKLIDLGKY